MVWNDAPNDYLKIIYKMKRMIFLRIVFTLSLTFWAGFAFSQSVIRVKGTKDTQLIRQQVQLSLDHLDIQENLHLTVSISARMPGKLKGITLSHPSPEPDKSYIIRVLIDARLSQTEQLLVLAHEMIHVKQYVKKELKVLDDRRVVWKEKVYFVSHGYNRSMPWEKEAYYAGPGLRRLVKSSQNQIQEILDGKGRSICLR